MIPQALHVNSIDLIKYYQNHYQFEQNLFTSSDDIKINYIARTYSNFTIPSYDKFYYLEKDLRGYSIEHKRDDKTYFNDTIISYKNGTYGEKVYSVSFFNSKEKYFNHENSFEIINSILKR